MPEKRITEDRGDTLIEVLVAVVIIGLTVTALLGMLLTTATASESHRGTASFDGALASFSEVARNAIELQASNGSTTPKFSPCSTGYTVVGNPTPSSGPPGTVVTVLGTGFTPVSVLGVKQFASAKSIPALSFTSYASSSSGTSGDIAQFTIPAGTAAGSYQVYPFDGTNAAPTMFTVTSGSLPSPAETIGADALTYDTLTTTINYWNSGWTSNLTSCSGSNYNPKIQQIQLSLVDSAPKNGASASQAFDVADLNPVTLTASSPAAQQITLTWSASSFAGTALHYNVYRSTTSGGPWGASIASPTPATNCTSGSCSYTDSTATSNNTVYYYEVTAVTASGESQPSDQAVGTTLPGAPTGLVESTTSTAKQVPLAWNAPSGNATVTYNIYCSTTSGAQGSEVTNVTATTYTDAVCASSALVDGNNYYYEVTAVNAGGEGTASPQHTGVTLPGAPQSVNPTSGNNQVSLSWSPPSPNGNAAVSGYNVYCSTASGTQGPKANAALITAPSPYSDTMCNSVPIANGQVYYLQMTAQNAGGEGPVSAQVSIRAGTPSAPTALAATTPSNTSVKLTWAAPTTNPGGGSITYNVYFSTANQMPTTASQTGVSGLTATVSGLTHKTPYYFWVTAVNPNGEGVPASTQATP